MDLRFSFQLSTEPFWCYLPYLMVSFTADPQHLFALQLQLSGESVDGLVQRVDLMVQVGDAVATGTQLRL